MVVWLHFVSVWPFVGVDVLMMMTDDCSCLGYDAMMFGS